MSKHSYKTRTRYVHVTAGSWRQCRYYVNKRGVIGNSYWDSSPIGGKKRGADIPLTEVLDGWTGKRSEFHPVFHRRENLQVTPLDFCQGPPIGASLSIESYASKPNYICFEGRTTETKGALSIGGISIVASAPAAWGPALDWRKAYEALLDDVHGLLPAQKSIAVNVAEFTQLKRLVPGITKSIKRLLSWMRRDGNRTLKVRYRRGRELAEVRYRTVTVNSGAWCLRDLADLHLAASFGVLPLGSDIGELAGKLYEVKLHHAWFKAMSDGEAHTVRASVTSSVSRTSGGEGSLGITYEDQESCNVRGTLSARCRIRPVTSDVLNKRYFNQILGVNVPLQIAWELVPFSFVVDWFLPVGEVLSRFEPKRFFGSLAAGVTLSERWFSEKTISKVARSISFPELVPDEYGRDNKLIYIGGGHSTREMITYNRQTGWPELNWMPPKGHFGLKQAGLSLSLVVTRLFK